MDRVAKLLQIELLLGRKPGQLSGGQRQRVAMGRALVRNPKLFLFDEPLSNLDAKLRMEMRMEVKQLHARIGATIVYVTHDQIEAMTMATRIAVMHQGEVQQFADPDTVYHRPANLFVARFMGAPPMNTVAARLEVGSGGPVVIVGQGSDADLSAGPCLRSSRMAGQTSGAWYPTRMHRRTEPHLRRQPRCHHHYFRTSGNNRTDRGRNHRGYAPGRRKGARSGRTGHPLDARLYRDVRRQYEEHLSF